MKGFPFCDHLNLSGSKETDERIKYPTPEWMLLPQEGNINPQKDFSVSFVQQISVCSIFRAGKARGHHLVQ